MPTWPASLPQAPLLAGFRETAPKRGVRTEMDAGPAKQRRRFSAGVGKVEAAMVVTRAQLAVFRAFLDDDLAGGAVAFAYPHPVTGAVRSFRFVVGQEPSWAPDDDPGWWIVTMPLEILP